MNAIISVVGKDRKGILAKISNECFNYGANVEEVSQSVINHYFTMMMLINIDELEIEFTTFVDHMNQVGIENTLEVHVMHEDIFNSMHKI